MGAPTRMALAGILANLKQSDNCRSIFATPVHPNILRIQPHCVRANCWRERSRLCFASGEPELLS
ncbi:MAG: hypothetical protein MUE44_02015 [Oscillatoriaceae cyanobacterium Prado104]|nr:hypothetical protein [Oscillatoriaceae cyanobacterium Prado104]